MSYSIEGAMVIAISTLAIVVKILWNLQQKDNQETKKALEECEKDRLDLWRMIASLSNKACGTADCPVKSNIENIPNVPNVAEVKSLAESKIAKLENNENKINIPSSQRIEPWPEM